MNHIEKAKEILRGGSESAWECEACMGWEQVQKRVLAELEVAESKPEPNGTAPNEYMHESIKRDAVKYDMEPEQIIEALCHDNDSLQEQLAVKEWAIQNLEPFARFYGHIKSHLESGHVVICEFCGKSMHELEQGFERK